MSDTQFSSLMKAYKVTYEAVKAEGQPWNPKISEHLSGAVSHGSKAAAFLKSGEMARFAVGYIRGEV